MFGVEISITILQHSTPQYPGRNKRFFFNFMNQASGASTWEHNADTFTLTMPRNLYFKDESTGTTTTWNKEPVYGNPDVQPLLLRGDDVIVEWGYSYFRMTSGGGFDRNTTVTQIVKRFEGYITRIKNKTPFEIECKDNMYKLQQTIVDNKEWLVDNKTYTVEKMLKEMMRKSTERGVSDFTIKTDNFQHSIGKVSWSNFTIAQVLEDLRRTYNLQSFFRENELRVGVIRYYPEDRKTHKFHFQRNIIDDNLDYQRADDCKIGIVAKSINKVELVGITNSAGKKKTKHKQLTVTVGDPDGDLRTLFFWGVETTTELKKLAEKKLPFVKYEGFRGSFVTFALPFVKHGDIVELEDEVLPERNGQYMVKAVEQFGSSADGLRQRIHLDIRVDGLTAEKLSEFQNNGI